MDDVQANEPGAPDTGVGDSGVDQQQPQAPDTAATQQPANALAGRQTSFDAKSFTQGQQTLAAIKADLGLPKSASAEEVRNAINALRAAPPAMQDAYVDPDELEAVAPQTAERMRRMDEALWNTVTKEHGTDFAAEARALHQRARGLSGAEFAQELGEAILRLTYDPANDPDAGDQPAPAMNNAQPIPPAVLGGNEPSLAAPAQSGGQPTTVEGVVRSLMAKARGQQPT